jgi:hypothetical protein
MSSVHEIQPAYRAPMAARSAVRGTRRVMLIGAAASVAVFAAVLGLRALLQGGAPREVPVVTADDRPLRVRPEQPGGMTVPNQDRLIFERGAGRGAQPPAALAPPPETPQLPPAAPPRVAAAAPAPPPPAAQPAAVRVPPPVPATAPPATAPPAAAPAPAPAGRVAVQLAAVGSREEATAEWERLKRRAPDFFGNRRPQIVPLERDGRTFWRLRTDGFPDGAAARGFCEQVRARGLSCFVPSA